MSSPAPVDAVASLDSYRSKPLQIPTDLHLDGNVGGKLPPKVLEALEDVAEETLRCYPDKEPLEAKLAEHWDLDANQVLVTNGADDALDRICRAFVGAGRALVAAGPTFEMIERFVRVSGGNYREVPWWQDPLPVEGLGSVAVECQAAAIAVVTPNNPTGLVADTQHIEALARRFPEKLIIVDLAYIEFAANDPTRALLEFKNVVITRTLSKAWSLAGARVGYAMAREIGVVDALRNASGPFPVGALSLQLASSWLDHGMDHLRASQRAVRREREQLADALKLGGAEVLASQGNFVCAKHRCVSTVHAMLASLGIATRIFPERSALAGYVRISCPQDEQDIVRVIDGLAAVLRPIQLFVERGLLSDMEFEKLRTLAPNAGLLADALELPRSSAKLRGWWLARRGFDTARARGWVSLAYGLPEDEAQRAGAATTLPDFSSIVSKVQSAWTSGDKTRDVRVGELKTTEAQP